MPDLMIPNDDEMDFHEHMLENKSSVRNIRIIPGQDPAEWKEHWQDEDASGMCYRLVYCDGCGYFVGDTGYIDGLYLYGGLYLKDDTLVMVLSYDVKPQDADSDNVKDLNAFLNEIGYPLPY